MNTLKKAGIIGGALIGGFIGGAVSIIGHVSKKKFLNELGDNIIDSTILTGEIAGEAASGATDMVIGKLKKKPSFVRRGKKSVNNAGRKVVRNLVTNCKTILDSSLEMLDGVKQKDKKRIISGARTLCKIAAIGAITVGAVKAGSANEDKPD